MSEPVFEDERDEALALLWLDDDLDRSAGLAAKTIEAWSPSSTARPPLELRDEVVVAARAQRPPGPAAGPPPPVVGPIDTFRRTADQLSSLLATLDDTAWATPLPGYGTVAATVAHLVGIERTCLGWLGAAPAPAPASVADHRQAAQPAIDELAAAPRSTVCSTWRDLAGLVADAADALPTTHAVLAHDIPTDRDGLMLLRSFELWAHYDDIATALARPGLDIDAGRLLTLSRALAQAMPFAFAVSGDPSPDGRVRLVLIGPGGGTYDLTIGSPVDTPSAATIVVGAVEACRLAQRRVDPDQVEVLIEGDTALGRAVLTHVGAFARD